MARPDQTKSKNHLGFLSDDINQSLAEVWLATERFCTLVNGATKLKRRLPEAILLQTMASIMYRLLHMCFAALSFNETIRLALLAFCSQAFLQLPNLKIEETCLPSAYRECLASVSSSRKISPRLLLWLHMIGAVSVFGTADHVCLRPLLHASIRQCGVNSWSRLKDAMNTLIWIELVFDIPGEAVFNSMIASV